MGLNNKYGGIIIYSYGGKMWEQSKLVDRFLLVCLLQTNEIRTALVMTAPKQ